MPELKMDRSDHVEFRLARAWLSRHSGQTSFRPLPRPAFRIPLGMAPSRQQIDDTRTPLVRRDGER